MKCLAKHNKGYRGIMKALLMLPMALVASCGDDEGGFQGNLDNTLKVVAVSPAQGESFVDTMTTIELRLSSPLVTSSVDGKFQVTAADNGAPIQGTTSFADNDMVIVFTATNTNGQLPGNQQIKVTLQPGVQSVIGQTLQQPFISVFSTGTGAGFGSTSKPGVAPVITQFLPGSDFLTANAPQTFVVDFSECVPAQAVAAATTVIAEDWPLGLSQQLLLVSAQPDAYNDKRIYLSLLGTIPSSSEVKVKINAGMEDCNGDQLAKTYKKTYYAY